MKLELKVHGCLCSTEVFTINGIRADSCDFGDQCDRAPELAEDYACYDMRFERIPATAEVLAKYQITNDEYDEICEKLESELSFGNCGWCV